MEEDDKNIESEETQEQPKEEKKSIMIVSNDKGTRKLVKKALKKEYNVIEEEDGKGCLQALQDEKPALLLLDEEMEEKDGWQVLEEIKARIFNHSYIDSMSLPIAMLSRSPPSIELIQRTDLERLVDYIQKPMDEGGISSRVSKIMKRLSKIEKTERQVRAKGKILRDEYLKITRAMYLRRDLVKSLKEDLTQERKDGDYDEIIKLEKIINDQRAIINFYRNRGLEIEGIVKKS